MMGAALLGASVTAQAALMVGTYEGTFANPDYPPGGTEVITVTSQTPDGADFDISGYSDWLCNIAGDCHGRELWSGTLFSTDAFQFTGYALVANGLGAPVGLALATYTGTFSGNTISGTWAFVDPPGAGTWTASAVPEPSTLGLLGLGLAAACICIARAQG
jgi:hypothetical protein